ncbi:MAG: GGDEF domain-containing protein, partial [Pseudomonadota bacterium]|nr:GGDEF domain-containing protein [Pseudomonadota bacterium]
KKFNDTYGHLVGDKVLRFVALMLTKMIKGRDKLARYGGEEFAIVLPETDFAGGMSLASSIVSSIAKTRLIVGEKQDTLDPVTVSVGVACCREDDLPETLFERADQALYQAKQSGRNKAVGEEAS